VGKEGTVLSLSKEVPLASLYFRSELQGNGTLSHQQLEEGIHMVLLSFTFKKKCALSTQICQY